MIVRKVMTELLEGRLDADVKVRIGNQTFHIDDIDWKYNDTEVQLELTASDNEIAEAVGAVIQEE
jgi:hypothetical protein